MYDDVEFPQPVCSDGNPHPRHRIIGTWRGQCIGIEPADHPYICLPHLNTCTQVLDNGAACGRSQQAHPAVTPNPDN